MNKNSKVLALKYRPQNFDDLIGQEVVTQTIVNSIKANKIPNAYLFTGIRGVGKTTIARIIAKALNCTNGVENKCKIKCDNCDEITNSSHIDVLEMDAASKTGVDDVRDLIEFSRYGPSSAKYKIFIIDEVHMLSQAAFNAFLKTLEEPPAHAVFILATTEKHKILPTILSRCQIFDFKKIHFNDIKKFLEKISMKEKIRFEKIRMREKMLETPRNIDRSLRGGSERSAVKNASKSGLGNALGLLAIYLIATNFDKIKKLVIQHHPGQIKFSDLNNFLLEMCVGSRSPKKAVTLPLFLIIRRTCVKMGAQIEGEHSHIFDVFSIFFSLVPLWVPLGSFSLTFGLPGHHFGTFWVHFC